MKPISFLFFILLVQLLSGQAQDGVDFIHAEVHIGPKPEEKRIDGTVSYKFQVVRDTDSIFLDAKKMEFSSVLLDLKPVKHTNDGEKIIIHKKLKQGSTHFLVLSYKAKPVQTVYFLGWDDNIQGNEQIWTQGQGKYTSHWLPSLDDMNDKVEFDLNISFPHKGELIANGKIAKVKSNHNGGIVKTFDMQKPKSSYLVSFAIGNFEKQVLHSTSGIPIELYYEPKDSLKVEPTYRYSKRIFDFLEEEIGIPYPWQNYKQVPVQDFLYAGMENTTATTFSNTFMVDSIAFFDKNYVNVNAHELAHQWFGNLVTEQSGAHHWLHEGFATYYAYLAEKDIFGEDYFYWHLLETARALSNFSGAGNGEALTSPNAGSLTFYEKGAWALAMLKEKVGESNFKQGVKNYLSKYAYKNVIISNFMEEMEKVSGMGLSNFESAWLEESEFPFETAKDFLIRNSASIETYFQIKSKIGEESNLAQHILEKEWPSLKSDLLKHQLILDYGNQLSPGFIQTILKSEGKKVRQAVALSLDKIPVEVQKLFEALLHDQSYVTVESALYRLWTDFPDRQHNYLDLTDELFGLPNKNIRMLWLTLALITPDYKTALKPNFFQELNSYTGPEHHFEVRLLAFQYLKNMGGFNDETLKNLIEACSHHVWHFKKTCRKILKQFLKEEGNLARVEALYPSLGLEEQQYLNKTLGK